MMGGKQGLKGLEQASQPLIFGGKSLNWRVLDENIVLEFQMYWKSLFLYVFVFF